VKLPSEAVGSQRERQPRSGSPFCSFRAFQTELSQRAMMTASSSSATLIRFPVIFLLDIDIPGSTWGGKSRFGPKGSVVVKWPQAAVTVCQMVKDRERKSR
jgi:hypothetical protein